MYRFNFCNKNIFNRFYRWSNKLKVCYLFLLQNSSKNLDIWDKQRLGGYFLGRTWTKICQKWLCIEVIDFSGPAWILHEFISLNHRSLNHEYSRHYFLLLEWKRLSEYTSLALWTVAMEITVAYVTFFHVIILCIS